MDVLAVVHDDAVRAGVFGEAVSARGHRLEEWSPTWEQPLPRPLETYGAVLVFGGAMHADQDERHPWLREEHFLLRRLLELEVPVLGVCLGVQLLAKAAGAAVYPAPEPEIGWVEVELTDAGAGDPLLGRLPESFDAFQWHHYTYDIPGGGEELARSRACTQALRLGELAWGIQFHAEITLAQIELWIREDHQELTLPGEELAAQSRELIERWNELGRRLCSAFLEVAEQVGATV
jgi:GMP synthase-like glutamine amidotransferase